MCTLIVAVRVWQAAPVLVAANRDEQLGRPSTPPKVQTQAGVRFIAPRDLEAGGTWLGVNAKGVFVGITNRHGGQSGGDETRSRGLLVLDALAESSAAHALRKMASIEPPKHKPFHMLMADRESAHLVWNDGRRHRTERLAPGIHVVTERSLGAAPSARIDHLHARVPALFGPKVPELARLQKILSERRKPPFEGVCVNVPELKYGTRSSTIIYLGPEATTSRFFHCEGPPDQNDYADLSSDFADLLV